jgi:hypothetical protein
MSQDVMTLRFDGGRFALQELPVDSVSELTTFQALFVEVAKHTYLNAFNRRKLPNNFNRAAKLRICATAANTVGTVREGRYDATLGVAELGVLDECAPKTVEMLADAVRGGGEALSVSVEGRRLMAKIGESLGEEEVLTIADGTRHRAVLDFPARETLRALAPKPSETPWLSADVRAEVEGIDDHEQQFRIRHEGQVLQVSFDLGERDILMEAVRMRPLRLVTGRLSGGPRSAVLRELRVVGAAREIEVQKVWDRIQALESVPDGWLRGEGTRPTPVVRVRARAVLSRILVVHSCIPRPGIFPTPEGGIQAEWVLDHHVVDLRFPPDMGPILVEAVHGQSGDVSEEAFSARQVDGDNADKLVDWLRQVTGEEFNVQR